MKPKFAKLTAIENEQRISRETSPSFWCFLQRSLLITLRDRGMLSEEQLTDALALLRKECGGGTEG